jgi:hypothetical protein
MSLPDYKLLTRDELLNLAQQRDQLTDEGRLALDTEIATRNVGPNEIQSYARETLAQKRIEERRTGRSRYFYETRYKRFLGKKNRQLDLRRRVEEFDTTLWFVVGIPFVPLASYRIRRRFRRWWNPCPATQLHILETRPRDWKQILLTWGITAVIIVALYLLMTASLRRR